MKRFTLRMPESLFHRLELMAQYEGVSLNQYLVYSLTQKVSRAYRPIPVSQEEQERQKAELESFIKSLGTVTDEEFEDFLASGDPVDEAELAEMESEEIKFLRSKIAEARAKRAKTT